MLRKIVSLSLAWMFLVSSISGIILFIAPPGRIAYWADWSILLLTKSQWDHLHTITTILMIIVVLLHLYYNWKPFLSYMKDKVTKMFSLTKELLVSLLITIVIAVGSIYELPPFSLIVNLGDYVSEEWEVEYGTPPYNHAELDTVEAFCAKLKIDFEKAKEKLKEKNISFNEKHTLLDVANYHNISPQDIYNILVEKNQKSSTVTLQGSGMGKKTLTQVCEIRGLDIDSVLLKLEAKGIKSDKSEKFKDIAEKNNMNPMDVLKIIEE